ncbi:hypothetical protein [Actinomyces ruminis]|uniref:Uncharacterized protein n=1 Tax=Actinomyces ruminis TaxID=1937003 RepID=A0ABX4MB97_9ACTO|nr:hypothetical protein [Actinomyces ruminis]PHP52752.1 hypothetical protein BW737_007870 [Actinomyces ruminis]
MISLQQCVDTDVLTMVVAAAEIDATSLPPARGVRDEAYRRRLALPGVDDEGYCLLVIEV